MVEDYRIKFHTGRAELTGQYTVNRRGNTKAITKYVERYATPLGEFPPGDLEKKSKRRDKSRRRDGTFGAGQGILQNTLCLVKKRN